MKPHCLRDLSPLLSVCVGVLLAAMPSLGLPQAVEPDLALRQAIASPIRTPAFVARDSWRHPYETLRFFGLRPDNTVVELSPGAGWYREILAPYLSAKGHYIGATELPQNNDYAAPESVDLVLTFRNVHNWQMQSDATVQAVFSGAFRSLKHGGVLGVVEHRLPAGAVANERNKGYVATDYVIGVARAVGFRLDAQSEVNANPADNASHPGGVWALPPTYANKDADRASYQAIGESDRMTLKFVKP